MIGSDGVRYKRNELGLILASSPFIETIIRTDLVQLHPDDDVP